MNKEYRKLTQLKVYKLMLNDMRSSQIEMSEIAAIAFERQKLVDWYKDQEADEKWKDDNWQKHFKKGSDLEWYNPVFKSIDEVDEIWGHGIHEEWIREEILDDAGYLIIS